MAYITLEELEKILPGILNQWIDEDDESWEWIFNEIEQKCRIGKKEKKKDRKKWKTKIESMVDTHSTVLAAHRNDINELKRYIDNNLISRINTLSNNVEEAKSMAQIAKQRTEVDYTKCSQTDNKYKIRKCDQPITAASKCESCKHISKNSLDQPCAGCCYNGINISGMDKWEAKNE